MEMIRSNKFARLTAVAAVTLTALAGCGGGGDGTFDVDGFADLMSQDGLLTKDQAKCIGEYLDEKASPDAKDVLQKAIDDGDSSGETDNEEAADEISNLIVEATPGCITG